jgi:hypothetical protein
VAPKQPGHLIAISSIRPYQEDYQWKRKQSFTKQTGPPPPCNRNREACGHPGEVLVDRCANAMQNRLAHRARMALRERDTLQLLAMDRKQSGFETLRLGLVGICILKVKCIPIEQSKD